MTRKARLGLYLEDEEIKKQIKIAAARRGVSTTAYCAQAIRERLQRDGEMGDKVSKDRLALLSSDGQTQAGCRACWHDYG